MTKTMKNRILALALVAVMALMLAACSVSSSSTSTSTVTTSVTDENGNTTTNTTTTEVGGSVGTDGVNTTSQTTTETTTTGPDADELSGKLHDRFNAGAKGTNSDGDVFYYAWNTEEGNDNVMLSIFPVDDDAKYWMAHTEEVDDHLELTGYDDEGNYIPFKIESGEDGSFTLTFLENGIVANMEEMDFEEFVKDFVVAWIE